MTNSKIEKIKEKTYQSFFTTPVVLENTNYELADAYYAETVKDALKKEGIESEDYSLPSQKFIDKVHKEYEKRESIIDKLFADGDLLTYNINDDDDVIKQKKELISKGKTVVSSVAKFSLERPCFIACFSNGKVFVASSKVLLAYNALIMEMEKAGYPIKNVEVVDLDYIYLLNGKAQLKYKDRLTVVDIPSVDNYVEELIKNGYKCYTQDEEREYVALFSNGKLIVTDNPQFNDKIEAYISNNSYLYMKAREVVPHSYIKVIYEKLAEREKSCK